MRVFFENKNNRNMADVRQWLLHGAQREFLGAGY